MLNVFVSEKSTSKMLFRIVVGLLTLCSLVKADVRDLSAVLVEKAEVSQNYYLF